jgi:hypothetical protein
MNDRFNFDHAVTVGQLMAKLAQLPEDAIVVMASDAEGNSHSPLSSVNESMYLPETTWSGDAYPTAEELAEKMAQPGSGWSEEDAAPDDAVRCVLLGPVN